MKHASTTFLKVIICLIGIAALAALLWMPQIEGRNVNADWVTIYLRDPFLIYIYIGSTPFFAALYQAFKLLSLIQKNKAFSTASVVALRNIKYCALALIGFIAGAEAYIISAVNDDRAGAIALGIYITFAITIVATATAVFEKLLQNAVDLQSENDLTV